MAGLLRRIAGLYQRYQMAHDQVQGRIGPLRTATGQVIGQITHLERDTHRLHITGHIMAEGITLQMGDRDTTLSRPPAVEDTRPLHFDLALPRPAPTHTQAARLVWQSQNRDTQEHALTFPGPVRVQMRHLTGFVTAALRLIPAVWGWWRTRDPRYRGAVKRGLGLDKAARFQPLDAHQLPQQTAPETPLASRPEITIILPVYNGFEVLPECLRRVHAHTDLPWHLIIIEDGSTNAQVRPFLRDWATQDHSAAPHGGRVSLLTPETNLGFIGAVNLGLEAAGVAEGQAPENPVILLNSDAFVPPDWASRLIAPMAGPDADPSVASVTPMSNDAEITNAPVICVRQDLEAELGDQMDTVARRLDPVRTRTEMPSGVGFCMGLAPTFLAKVPRLDPSFGRGYGEEVDWCQKTRALGGRHLGLGSLFVEHRGGTSFGSAAKSELIARNGALISQRYPTYDLDVARFIAQDPLTTPRLSLALAWAGAVRTPLPVYMAHDMGGGAEIWLERRIAADLAQGLPSVVLRVGGYMRWQLEVHAPSGVTGAATDDFDGVANLLALLPARHLVYSCGVGDADPMSLPDHLLGLLSPQDHLEVLFHDWLPISPSYTLLDADGIYRGPVAKDRTDPAHQIKRPDGRVVTLPEWQTAWGRLMQRADHIRVFSEDGRAQIATAWPDLDLTELDIRGHPLPNLDQLFLPTDLVAQAASQPITLGIPGHLNRHKGAEVVAQLVRRLGSAGKVKQVVVLGRVDPECPLPRAAKVHGGYQVHDIPSLVRHYGITHWLLPAVWPETFSFSIHEVLATGLPVLAFDVGAQGAAVARAPHGHVIPFTPDDSPVEALLEQLQR